MMVRLFSYRFLAQFQRDLKKSRMQLISPCQDSPRKRYGELGCRAMLPDARKAVHPQDDRARSFQEVLGIKMQRIIEHGNGDAHEHAPPLLSLRRDALSGIQANGLAVFIRRYRYVGIRREQRVVSCEGFKSGCVHGKCGRNTKTPPVERGRERRSCEALTSQMPPGYRMSRKREGSRRGRRSRSQAYHTHAHFPFKQKATLYARKVSFTFGVFFAILSVILTSIPTLVMAKATKSKQKQVSALHQPVKSEHALMALFVALAVFFFTFNGVVESERAAASVSEQVVVSAQ
jgi:hypothetical protein